MSFDTNGLIACGVKPTQAKQFIEPLIWTCAEFGIVTVSQRAAFVAQTLHESAFYCSMEENLWYSKPETIWNAFERLRPLGMNELSKLTGKPKALAIAAYSNRNGNGGPETEDGWTYRGRCPLQLTGKDNYAQAGKALGLNLLAQPERVAEPAVGMRVAGWFWAVLKKCNELMDNGQFDETTHRINGGYNGREERRALYASCLIALH
jgi:putative chitinase